MIKGIMFGCVTNIVDGVLQGPVPVAIDRSMFDNVVSVTQILGAIGTVAAAWVAVVLARRKGVKEKLDAEPVMSNARSHYEFVVSGVDNATRRALIWLGIKNTSPSSTIHNCQVYVDSIYHNATGQSSGRRYKLLCSEHARSLAWSRPNVPGECQTINLAKQIPQFVCIAEISNPPSLPQPSAETSLEVAPPCNANPLVPQLCVKVGRKADTRIDKNPQDVLVKFCIVGDGLDCKVGYLQLIWKGTRSGDLSEENRHLLEAAVLTEEDAAAIIIP